MTSPNGPTLYPPSNDVFVSFARPFRGEADQIYAPLKTKYKCFMLYRDAPLELGWGSKILGTLKRSRVMLLLFSNSIEDSDWVRFEITIGLSYQVPILVIALDGPPSPSASRLMLSEQTWMDASSRPFEAVLPEILSAVQKRVEEAHATENNNRTAGDRSKKTGK
ncbi:MAG: toll/interleukin-1 receptor domain-containing protein [bacterium]